jgi:hypothetical protein
MRAVLRVAGAVLAASLVAAPAASAGDSTTFYRVVSATGSFDAQEHYDGTPPDCVGALEWEEHADFKFRRVRTGDGGALFGGVGALVVPLGGGYDGVFRDLDGCSPKSSCEHHFGWAARGGNITISVNRGQADATLTPGVVYTDSCPLLGKNGYYLGRDKISRRERRARRITLKFRQDEPITRNGAVTGSFVTTAKVVLKRGTR